jgi:hypothetical protein
VRQLRLRLPVPPRLHGSPELAPLAILEAALTACEASLLASYAEIYHGTNDDFRRGSSVVRASSIIVHARRLATVIAGYREALERDDRRAERERNRRHF